MGLFQKKMDQNYKEYPNQQLETTLSGNKIYYIYRDNKKLFHRFNFNSNKFVWSKCRIRFGILTGIIH